MAKSLSQLAQKFTTRFTTQLLAGLALSTLASMSALAQTQVPTGVAPVSQAASKVASQSTNKTASQTSSHTKQTLPTEQNATAATSTATRVLRGSRGGRSRAPSRSTRSSPANLPAVTKPTTNRQSSGNTNGNSSNNGKTDTPPVWQKGTADNLKQQAGQTQQAQQPSFGQTLARNLVAASVANTLVNSLSAKDKKSPQDTANNEKLEGITYRDPEPGTPTLAQVKQKYPGNVYLNFTNDLTNSLKDFVLSGYDENFDSQRLELVPEPIGPLAKIWSQSLNQYLLRPEKNQQAWALPAYFGVFWSATWDKFQEEDKDNELNQLVGKYGLNIDYSLTDPFDFVSQYADACNTWRNSAYYRLDELYNFTPLAGVTIPDDLFERYDQIVEFTRQQNVKQLVVCEALPYWEKIREYEHFEFLREWIKRVANVYRSFDAEMNQFAVVGYNLYRFNEHYGFFSPTFRSAYFRQYSPQDYEEDSLFVKDFQAWVEKNKWLDNIPGYERELEPVSANPAAKVN